MREPKRDLTDRALRALKPAAHGKRAILWDAQVAGFGVRYNDRTPPDRTFVLVTRYPGSNNPAPRAIGEYPTIELAKAREIARKWREDIKAGIDPKDKAEAARLDTERAKREVERRQANTFRVAFEAFEQEHLSTLRTGEVVAGVVRKHVFPTLGDWPLVEITRADGNELLRGLVKKIPTGANRVRSYLRTFGAWAEDDGRIEDGESPFANLKRLTKEKARDRVLDDLEIRAIWGACADLGAFGRAVRFMLATGQRRSEVGDAEWREVEIAKKLWTLPRERTKADRGHEVPLSPLALSVLDDVPRHGPHVFTTRGAVPKGGQGRLSTTAPISGWSKFKDRLDGLTLAELKRLAGDDAILPEWHLHDLRRTAATHMARGGVDRVVISKVLNHAEGGVTKIYDKYGYLDEKRAALDRWGARLAAIVEGHEAANVIPFAGRG
jgi:integrase